MDKAQRTRERILDQGVRLASLVGLEGLTLGHLAAELRLSKSGLYAHFGSKETLQLEVLEAAARHFIDEIVRPALREPRGAPRVVALAERWLAWSLSDSRPGGCVFVAAATELDDRPGPVRDALVQAQRDWLDTLATACRLAQAEGHYREHVEPEQFAFELHALLLGFHHGARLLRDPDVEARTRRAFEALVTRCSAESPR